MAQGVRGTVVMDEKYRGGLRDIEGFSRLILIYAFHRSNGYSLEVTPFLDIVPHGVFATRAPERPNAIGLLVIRLVAVNKNELTIGDVDILDVIPLFDIKPYVPAFECSRMGRPGGLIRAATRSRPCGRTGDSCKTVRIPCEYVSQRGCVTIHSCIRGCGTFYFLNVMPGWMRPAGSAVSNDNTIKKRANFYILLE